ncbi:hypothetical protein [Methylocystis heyeri]|uniref:Uncharacterized protein n=1 Tax=Methylocystis heyeri TaxID=391905 RepID=A0A6B8KL23_9HYPH|nr:hypothetical protein [Methylocystis heyeri]QGM47851.1 hypothetical protein H2LOC_020425 [Methylocystis heyeri]
MLQVVAKRSGLIAAFIANRLPSSLPPNRWLVVLAAFVFLGSNLVFAFSLQWAPALSLICGALVSAALVWRQGPGAESTFFNAPIDGRLWAFCAALGVALALLGGETHFLYANLDWLIRDAVLGDLTHREAPVHYQYQGVEYFLRAPIGMYLLPATVGKFLGLQASHGALLAQNALLCAITLYIVGSLAGGWKLVLLMVVFSGADVVPNLTTFFLHPHSGGLPDDFELWNGQIQYTSHLAQLFWVPNHALPGWFFGALCLLAVQGEVDLAVLGVCFAAAMIWSPLAILPGLVYLPYLAWRTGSRLFSSTRLWLGIGAGAAFLPVAIYLTIEAAAVPHGLLPIGAGLYLVFICVEIPQAFLLIWLWGQVRSSVKGLLAASIAILLVLPLFSFGPYNDLVMRGSIAPLFILAFAFSDVALRGPPDRIWQEKAVFWIVSLGLFTPVLELKRALVHPAFAISSCNFLTASHQLDSGGGAPTNYLARVETAPANFLRATTDAALTVTAKPCWPDHPLRALLAPLPRE